MLSGQYLLGAAANAFYINNAASILPRNFMAKASAYFSGAAADVLEVKRNEYRCYIDSAIPTVQL